jgi:hypothetical protein
MTMMKYFSVLYTFDGQKYWGDVDAKTHIEARRAFLAAHRGQNVQILDVSVETVLTVAR